MEASVIHIEPSYRKAVISLATLLIILTAWGPAWAAPRSPSRSDPDYFQFPTGKRIHKSCIHHVPRGGAVAPNGDVVIAGRNGRVVEHVGPCLYEPISSDGPTPVSLNGGNGNVEWVEDHPTNGPTFFDEMGSEIIVPDNPPNSTDGETIFLWVGTGSTQNANVVLQPVLEYSISALPPGCGSFTSPTGWMVLTYYIDQTGRGYCGTTTNVNSGDTIDMGVWLDNGESCDNTGLNCSYQAYYSVNGGIIDYFEIFGEPVLMNVAVLGSLEAYFVRNCADLPPNGELNFSLFALNVPVPNWDSYQNALNYSFWKTQTQSAAAAGLPECHYVPQFTDEVHLTYTNSGP
jgi:hypothetical protein